MRKLIGLLLFFCLLSFGFSTDYYVKNGGNDGLDGESVANAWLTIGQANTTLIAGDTVYILAGTYAEAIKPDNSGSDGSLITYENYENDEVILSGSYIVLTGWELHAGSIYKTSYAETWYGGLWEDDFATAGYFVGSDLQTSLVDVDEAGRSYLNAGTLTVYIWLKDSDNPGGHTIRIGTGSASINSNGKSYIKVDGIKTYYAGQGVGLSGSSHCVIQNCVIHYGYANGIQLSSNSDYNQILNNEIKYSGSWYRDSGNGIFIDSNCDHNLIEKNDIAVTGHNSITSYGSSGNAPHHNIYQDNEVYDGGSSGLNCNVYPYKEVWRRNKSHGHTGAGIQSDSSDNVFAHNLCWYNGYLESAGSQNIQMYSVASSDTDDNYIFHNVFYDSMGESCFLGEWGTPTTSNDNNIFKNNIFYLSAHNTKMVYSDSVTLRSNVWKYNIICDDVTASVKCTGIGTETLTWYETNHASNFNNNIQSDPRFVDATNDKFDLHNASPAIDAGDWLTTITSETGSGTSFVVDDARYFCDGYGITDADEINIEGKGGETITDVNYGTNTITVSNSVSWTQGDGICLSYDILGRRIRHAPDIGAHENQTNVLFSPAAKLFRRLYENYRNNN